MQFALVLTVAAIPVAMPTVLSVTMAVGARLLARKQAIVSRLAAIEELAGVDVLCADKTGTLTQNSLTLGDPFAVNGVTVDQVILCGALASRADNDDPIDLAVLAGLPDGQALHAYQVGHFDPFDAVRKRTEAAVDRDRRRRVQGDQGRAAGHPGAGRQRGRGASRASTRRSTTSRPAAFARSVSPDPTATATGGSSACCRCSTRRATTPRRPSPPPTRWA